jgi:hypothetical protein
MSATFDVGERIGKRSAATFDVGERIGKRSAAVSSSADEKRAQCPAGFHVGPLQGFHVCCCPA